jgi:hypothetical protein
MERNLDWQFETLAFVHNPAFRKRIYDAVLAPLLYRQHPCPETVV